MCNFDMSTSVIIWLFLIIILIIDGILDEIKFRQFCSRLYVGNKLYNIVKSMCNEFDEEHLFCVTIIKISDKQVIIRFTDGSETIMYKRQLFFDGWKFINNNN